MPRAAYITAALARVSYGLPMSCSKVRQVEEEQPDILCSFVFIYVYFKFTLGVCNNVPMRTNARAASCVFLCFSESMADCFAINDTVWLPDKKWSLM